MIAAPGTGGARGTAEALGGSNRKTYLRISTSKRLAPEDVVLVTRRCARSQRSWAMRVHAIAIAAPTGRCAGNARGPAIALGRSRTSAICRQSPVFRLENSTSRTRHIACQPSFRGNLFRHAALRIIPLRRSRTVMDAHSASSRNSAEFGCLPTKNTCCHAVDVWRCCLRGNTQTARSRA